MILCVLITVLLQVIMQHGQRFVYILCVKLERISEQRIRVCVLCVGYFSLHRAGHLGDIHYKVYFYKNICV